MEVGSLLTRWIGHQGHDARRGSIANPAQDEGPAKFSFAAPDGLGGRQIVSGTPGVVLDLDDLIDAASDGATMKKLCGPKPAK